MSSLSSTQEFVIIFIDFERFLAETNMIPDDTVNGQPIVAEKLETTPQCILCEFIMSQIESKLKNNATDEEIEKVVKNVCRIMPKSVRPDCDKFMDENLDKIIRILVVTLDPEDACKMMALCGPEAVLEENKRMLETVEKMRKQVFNCAVCEATLDSIREIMKNPKIDQHYDHVLEKACRGLPAQYKEHVCSCFFFCLRSYVIDVLICSARITSLRSTD